MGIDSLSLDNIFGESYDCMHLCNLIVENIFWRSVLFGFEVSLVGCHKLRNQPWSVTSYRHSIDPQYKVRSEGWPYCNIVCFWLYKTAFIYLIYCLLYFYFLFDHAFISSLFSQLLTHALLILSILLCPCLSFSHICTIWVTWGITSTILIAVSDSTFVEIKPFKG